MDKGYIDNDDEKTSNQMSGFNRVKITMLEGAAQAFVFWLGGFETSSTTATNCLYELAVHQDLQGKLVEEIDGVLAKFGSVSYDSINKMPYLYKVISGWYSPLTTVLHQSARKKLTVTGTGLRVAKGTAIIIPVYGLHSDPDVFPEREKFDPERFTEENVASRHRYTYLPFGEGLRNCMGMRFGLVQTKVAIISFLSKYSFTPGPNLKDPMVMDVGNLMHCPDSNGIVLRIEER
ncbi:probable cytochrome P450 6a17 [Neodiprion pinetum]|uniref:probable cytochrome P450 6a17 n=1 Tax=Neodiprion pinetum TaxID=441929 RepID=UPI00371B0D82